MTKARHFTDESKRDNLLKIVAPVDSEEIVDEREADGPTPIHSSLTAYATILSPGASVSHKLSGSQGYVHLIQTSGYNKGEAMGAMATVGTQSLREGDGAHILASPETGELLVSNAGDIDAELVLFDIEHPFS